MTRLLALLLALSVPGAAAASRAVGVGLALELPGAELAEDSEYRNTARLAWLELPVAAGALRLAPAFGYASGGDGDVTRLAVGLGAALQLDAGDEVRAWAGPRVGAIRRTHGEGDGLLDLFAGLAAGGELFLHERVSVGGEVRVTWTSVDRSRWVASTAVVPVMGRPGVAVESETLARGWTLGADGVVALRFYPW